MWHTDVLPGYDQCFSLFLVNLATPAKGCHVVWYLVSFATDGWVNDKILPNKESLHRRHCRCENHWSCFLWLKSWDLGIFHIRKLFRSYSVKFAFEKKKKKRTIYLNKGRCNLIPQESFIISPLNINLLNVFQKGTFNHK